MRVVALALSVVMAALGALGVVSPDAVVGIVRGFATQVGQYAAVAIRLVFGVALFVAAPASRAPRTLRVLGVVIFVAGLVTLTLGLETFTALVERWSGLGRGFIRAWGAVAFAAGLSLAYAVLPKSRAA